MMKRAVLIYWIIFLEFLIPFILGKNIIALADSFHDLIDAISVTFSYYVEKISTIRSSIYTYGLHRLEIFSALVNFLVIILGSAFVLYLSFVDNSFKFSLLVIVLSFLAIVLLLSIRENDNKDMNKKSVFLHSIFDMIAYIIGIITLATTFFIPSKIIIIAGAVGILVSSILISFNVLKQSILILLEGSPINAEEVERELKTVNPGVHHVHIWAICGHVNVATIHIEVNEDMTIREVDEEREKIEKILKDKYNIDHVTIQFESKKVD